VAEISRNQTGKRTRLSCGREPCTEINPPKPKLQPILMGELTQNKQQSRQSKTIKEETRELNIGDKSFHRTSEI
jgi:hypothetical protein